MVVMIHNPHKRFFCLFSYAGTPRRQLIEVEVSLNAFILSEYRPLGKIKSRERMQSLTNLIRHTKISCPKASLVSRRFLCGTYRNGQH